MKYLNARNFMKLYDVDKKTLYNWRKTNKVDYIKLGEKSYLYHPNIKATQSETTLQKQHIAYARVSNTKQQKDLLTQEEELLNFITKQGNPATSITDIASGMNENRSGFNKLIDLVTSNQVDTIYITYKDRLTRFGFEYFVNLFQKYQTKIVILNNTETIKFEDELVQDLISIMHHFSMKVYSHRRAVLKSAKKQLESVDLEEKC